MFDFFSSSFSGLYWLQITVTEEKRLAVSVHQIDAEVSVVPRGAFIKSPRGLVQLNRSFCGKYVYTVGEITIWSPCFTSLTKKWTVS